MDAVFAAIQGVLPHRALSRAVGALCRLELGPLSRLAIRIFITVYSVDMSEAAESRIGAYRSFNEFFTRPLAPSARPLEGDESTLICPADGAISEVGAIAGSTLLQAKGIDYELADLLGGDARLAALFERGGFATIYLAPHNYHRVHFPLSGTLRAMRYMPGTLYSVNRASTRRIPRLFCRNERVAAVFETEGGWYALVMVGAMNVGSIELLVPPSRHFRNRPAASLRADETHAPPPQSVTRGAEFGRFNMGSTVLVLTSPGLARWHDTVRAGCTVRVGQALAQRPFSKKAESENAPRA